MKCIQCNCEHTYEIGNIWNCPQCGLEWTNDDLSKSVKQFKDSNGNILNDGDTIVVIKDLKIKNSNNVIKQGTKVKKIKLVENDHNIDCKIDGIGQVSIKSIYVKKQ